MVVVLIAKIVWIIRVFTGRTREGGAQIHVWIVIYVIGYSYIVRFILSHFDGQDSI